MNIKAMEYLQQNQHQNIPAIGALKRGAEAVLLHKDGVILYEMDTNLYYLSVDDNKLILTDWLNKQKKAEVLVLREKNIDAVAAHIGARTVSRCRQMVFLAKPPSSPNMDRLRIEPLTVSDADFVCKHYVMMLDRGYMEERLLSGNIFGAYYNNELVGFAGRHSDGSIGMLEILPQFRRLGIGTALGSFLIQRILLMGDIPYAHIFADNAASLAMTSRIEGAVLADELIAWLA